MELRSPDLHWADHSPDKKSKELVSAFDLMYIQLENMCGAILLNNVLLNNYNEFYYCMSFSLYFHYPK